MLNEEDSELSPVAFATMETRPRLSAMEIDQN